ncbi:MAG: anaerobic ribonucleoside-triphosphate reductase activating protein [Mollicutes bacterium]|nr:anaerobic ribonucleoside-triphosphate reductase activating protein [Mollicutes bacterium]
MKYAKIRKMDISNGEGVRVSLFVQGCSFHCKNCFNQETWDFNGGKEFTTAEIQKIIELADKDYIAGLSILGGEPLHNNNVDEVFHIVATFKEKFPNKDIWLWTGFKFEDAIKDSKRKLILCNIDVLIDGQFEEDKKDITLKWRGSSNQRVIDCKKSLAENKVILKED